VKDDPTNQGNDNLESLPEKVTEAILNLPGDSLEEKLEIVRKCWLRLGGNHEHEDHEPPKVWLTVEVSAGQ